ncbi:MAG: ATP-binding protein [Vallitaleaceae bacterium]|nr:ATP-binding protein [Vallitaleaceae bacterium]
MVYILIGLIGLLFGIGATYLVMNQLAINKAQQQVIVIPPKNYVFAKTDDIILIFNDEYKLVDYNTSAKKYYTLNETSINKSIQSIDEGLFLIVKSNTLSTSTKKNIELDKGSKTNHFLMEQHPLKVEDVNRNFYFLSLRDNTNVHMALAELKTLKKAAEDSIGEKSMFLANMSHELRTPLNALIGMSELMIETSLDENQQDLITSINQSANILYDIINTILDFSKLEANQMGLESAPIDIIKIMGEIATIFTHEAKVKNIAFNVTADNHIPTVLGDQVRLRQIIVNLVGNAIKFTHLGSVNLTANLLKKYKNNVDIEFIIADTGIGFNEDTKERIFNPFVQEDDSITRQFGGTGLGLPICKSLIDMYGGTLHIKSAVGVGSTFTFIISFKLTETDFSIAETKVATSSTQKTGRILVAEDNKTNQKLLKMQLQKYKYEVSIVDNGQEVVEEYFENPYDIIIMDCQMPIMDGYCATLIIRQQEELFDRHIPIIALTASALKEDKEKCIQTGMDDYITKPVKIETLHQTIQTWLNKPKG